MSDSLENWADELEIQLTEEIDAHAETRRQLEELYKALEPLIAVLNAAKPREPSSSPNPFAPFPPFGPIEDEV